MAADDLVVPGARASAAKVQILTQYPDLKHNHAAWWQLRWTCKREYPDSKVHGANMGPIWGQQDPGGPHVDPTNLATWVTIACHNWLLLYF